MHSTSLLPLLSTRVASMLRTLNTSEGSRVTLALSSFLQGWLDLCDKASGLPISCPGWWRREKLKCERKRDQCTCQCLSFSASHKYASFQWSVRISNFSVTPSRKCHHLSSASM